MLPADIFIRDWSRRIWELMAIRLFENNLQNRQKSRSNLGKARRSGPSAAQRSAELTYPTSNQRSATAQIAAATPEFTGFVETGWSLTDRMPLIAGADCAGRNASIFTLISQVDEQWNELEVIADNRFRCLGPSRHSWAANTTPRTLDRCLVRTSNGIGPVSGRRHLGIHSGNVCR
jgi:hypothetical protein